MQKYVFSVMIWWSSSLISWFFPAFMAELLHLFSGAIIWLLIVIGKMFENLGMSKNKGKKTFVNQPNAGDRDLQNALSSSSTQSKRVVGEAS